MTDRKQLHHDGYALLRQAVPVGWLDGLRTLFDAGITPRISGRYRVAQTGITRCWTTTP